MVDSMAGSEKVWSVTPEPKRTEEELFLTAPSQPQALSPEVLSICFSLCINPSDLQPKSLSDFQSGSSRLAAVARLSHYEEIRKAKWVVIQRELMRRHTVASKQTVSRGTDSPLSAVSILTHRFDYLNSRIQTTRRVTQNQAKLSAIKDQSNSLILQQYQEKIRKVEENRKLKDEEMKTKAENWNKKREDLVEKGKKMREKLELAEIRRAKKRQNDPKYTEKSPEISRSLSQNQSFSSNASEITEISSKLAAIEGKLLHSANRVEEKLQKTRQNLRNKLKSAEIIHKNRVKTEAEAEMKRLMDIKKLLDKEEKHTQNRLGKMQETIRRLAENSKKNEEKHSKIVTNQEKMTKNAEKMLEKKEEMRMKKIEKIMQNRYEKAIKQSQKTEERQDLAEEYRELLHELRVNERERLMMKWKKEEQALWELREVREHMRHFQEKANMQLKQERDQRFRSLSRGFRSAVASVPLSP